LSRILIYVFVETDNSLSGKRAQRARVELNFSLFGHAFRLFAATSLKG